MPFKTWDTWADYQGAYDIGAEPDGHPNTRDEVRLSYHRAVMFPIARDHAVNVVRVLNWQPSMKIVVIGCGFGWFIEVLKNELGYTNVVGTDIGLYVQTNKGGTEEADINAAIQAVGLNPLLGDGAIAKGKLFDGGPRARVPVLNEDARTNQSRTRIKQALIGGGAVDWAFTESVLESLTDAETTQGSGFLHQLATNVGHLVVTTRPGQTLGEFNWKTLAEWKALLPNDIFVEAGTYAVL